MIYFEPELQNRLLPVFHYALNPDGVLFISPSESIGRFTDLFAPVNRKWKFYRARQFIPSARTERIFNLPVATGQGRELATTPWGQILSNSPGDPPPGLCTSLGDHRC